MLCNNQLQQDYHSLKSIYTILIIHLIGTLLLIVFFAVLLNKEYDDRICDYKQTLSNIYVTEIMFLTAYMIANMMALRGYETKNPRLLMIVYLIQFVVHIL